MSSSITIADEFTQLEPGIYKEFVGDMKIEKSKWNMIITYDIEELNINLKRMHQVFNNTIKACNLSEKIGLNSCRKLINLESINLFRLEKDKKRISELFKSSNQKTELFNLGLKFFFGSMTDDDALKIGEQIIKLENNKTSFSELLVNQINIIDNLFKLENDTIEKPIHRYHVLEEELEVVTITFDESMKNFKSLFNLIKSDLQNLEQLLIDTNDNILNSKILSSSVLIDEIKKNLLNNPNKELPMDNNSPDIKGMINFLKLGYMYTKNKLYIIVQIPLMEKTKYKIYDLQAIPVCKEKVCVSYDISTDLYAVNEENKDHFKINTYFMEKNCKIMNSIYYCSNLKIRYTNIENNCETALHFSNQKNVEKYCKHKAFEIEDKIIVKLFNENSYLLISTNEENVLLKCGEHRNYINLNGIMKIVINRDCELIFKTMIVQFHHFSSFSTESNFVLFEKYNFEITEEITNIIKNNEAIQIWPHVIDSNQYKNIGEKVEVMKKEFYAEKNKEKNKENASIYIPIIIISILMIFVIICFMIYIMLDK